MNFLKLLSLVILSVSFSAHAAIDYKCVQNKRFSPIDPAQGEIRVNVEILKTMLIGDDYQGEYVDYVYKVKIDVKKLLKNRTSTIKSFVGIATSSDVLFIISDKENGVNMRIYMDELDQSHIRIRNKNAKPTEVTLDCGIE